jgi:hypothetical protein
MPGGHDAPPVTLLQLAPIVPPEPVQLDPLQQRLGCGAVWGVHVRLGAQPPVESQRHPWVPTMHVEPLPAPEPAITELPPAPLEPLLPPGDRPPPPPSVEPGGIDDEPPHAEIASKIDSGAPTGPRPRRHMRSGMTLLSFIPARGTPSVEDGSDPSGEPGP